MGPVIAIVGPSGVGKDTVMAALVRAHPGLETVRRVITRSDMAGGEASEAVSQEAFDRMVEHGRFVLHWQAHGLSYGIPATIRDQQARAAGVLVNLSRSVLRTAQDVFGHLIVISLTASQGVLARRLEARGRETATDRAGRLDRAALALPDGLDHVHEIDNGGSLDETVQQVLAVLTPPSA